MIGFGFPLPLLHGPFLYLYVANRTNRFPQRKFYQYAHFLPALLMYIYLIHFFILPADKKIEVMQSGGAEYPIFNAVNQLLIALSGISYVSFSQFLLIRHRKQIREQFSNIEKINLNWLQYVILGICFIWVVVLLGNLLPVKLLALFKANNMDSDVFVFTAVVLFVCFLGFFGLRQTNVFIVQADLASPLTGGVPEVLSELKESEKYAKSGLKDSDAEQLHRQLNDYMKIQKPYLNSDLSLSKLGENFGIHTNYLSQVINDRENKNFYDYINEFRIEEFKRLASNPKNKNYTILTLAFECGFNSKSAFNNCFKKLTHQTPSEYMKLLK